MNLANEGHRQSNQIPECAEFADNTSTSILQGRVTFPPHSSHPYSGLPGYIEAVQTNLCNMRMCGMNTKVSPQER